MLARLYPTSSGGTALLPRRRLQIQRPALSCRQHPVRCPSLRQLHESAPLRATASNHYETLGLLPDSSQADIKKRYYQLSKTTHPDRNRDDPKASARFSAVSDAYATLGNAEKRARYDRDVMRTSGGSAGHGGRSGSYSSSQAGPYGSRPASGLSKRRSPFQGPPPSFYKAGGYGAYGGRASQAEANADSARKQAGSDYSGGWSDASTGGGFSPGQGARRGFGNDVPHFDREGHYRTQENVMGKTAGRKKRLYREYAEDASAGMATGSSFFIITAVVAVTILIPFWFMNGGKKEKRREGGQTG